MTMTPEKAKELRNPFPPSVIGKLPKGGVMLDFVGHAAVTDRLLAVDPAWSWEPLALDDHGLPALDKAGNLWIKLTICGVTRLGVGDGKSAKECIGDALRNAAMRFGVALDLWSKQELSEFHDEPREVRPVSNLAPPPLAAAKARAWTALKKIKPDFHNDELQSFTAAALEARGSSIADASADLWNSLAQDWETAA